MTPPKKEQITKAHFELPEDCRSEPASAEQLEAFEREYGAIPPDYRWYLAECGGGVIGSEWIDDVEELTCTHRKVREGQRRGFYCIAHFFPLGWDGAGNPYGYDLESGGIVAADHNISGIHKVASDFYELLRSKGLINNATCLPQQVSSSLGHKPNLLLSNLNRGKTPPLPSSGPQDLHPIARQDRKR